MIGSTISHYRILDKLGQGGMGEVFLAKDTELERRVAIKFLPPHVAQDEKILQRFQREAKATAALQHPNIVTIHEIGTHESRRFIVMEFVEGDLLSDRISRGDISVADAIDILVTLCDALAEAHGANVIHRDLKPDNIIIDKRGQPRVLDFGLAVHGEATRLTQEGATVGTLHYMSPEQSHGDDVDGRTDIFSLGAIAYEMITRQKAFPGDQSAAILYKIANEEPQPMARYNNEVTDDLERVVATALAKDCEIRYQTMRGFGAALKPLQSTRGASGISAAGSSSHSGRPGADKATRNRWTIAVAAVMIGAITIGYMMLSPDRSPVDTTGITTTPQTIGQIRTIAVLPLKNASEDPEESYFADALTEAIIHDLSRVSALSVFPASTVIHYKNSDKPVSEIAAELGADAIIGGSVWHADGRVRINIDLIPAGATERLWGESYESEFNDLLTLQSDLAREITGQVKVSLAPLEIDWLNGTRSVKPEAHKTYLKGLYYRNLMTFDGFTKAGEHFERAVALDPSFAPAYVALADIRMGDSPWPVALELVDKAIELDAMLAEAHGMLAKIRLRGMWDWDGAREAVTRAAELQPNSPMVHRVQGDLLLLAGKDNEGLAEYRTAVALSPLSHPIACSLVSQYNNVHDYDRVIDYGIEVNASFPECPYELQNVGEAFMHKGQYAEALEHLAAAQDLHDLDDTRALLGCVYALSGRTDEANAVLRDLIESNGAPYAIAVLQATLGNKGKALDSLEDALEKHSGAMLWLDRQPLFDDLRDDPRFVELVKKINLPTR